VYVNPTAIEVKSGYVDGYERITIPEPPLPETPKSPYGA
jgi:hypothetical protein